MIETLLQENQHILKRMKENDEKGWEEQTQNFKIKLKKDIDKLKNL